MLRISALWICSAMLAVALLPGCSAAPTTLTTGMKTQDAIDAMDQRGIVAGQMGYSSIHSAFDLPDGRTVVVIGSPNVTEIQVILKSDAPKADREMSVVQTIEF